MEMTVVKTIAYSQRCNVVKYIKFEAIQDLIKPTRPYFFNTWFTDFFSKILRSEEGKK